MTTPRRELPPRYDAAAVEPAIYERWVEADAFRPAETPPPGAERFVVIQPPPNVTGALHIGHALTFIVEDVMVRYHRMRGDDTLWLPGVDHSGIGAQFVLDKMIAADGESRASLGRERYLERMWQFMNETRPVIRDQLRRFGASLDWSRERFTMDEGSARAVRVAFKRLWDAGLVYRGEALVNWCPRCLTTISDLENVHREETGTLWTIRYHLEREDGTPDPDAWISVATTRPETLLGDTAVAVHPDDERYRHLVGRHAILPFLGRRLPIVADEHVERAFGTGAVKITPAHDPDDYELAKRHELPAINVLDDEARINSAGGDFFGRDRYEAREAILDRLREMGDLEADRPHPMVVGHCERCGTVIEPRLSVQWFIRVKPLAERALASVREGRTKILPPHFEKVYAHWMENIHDWAVGRQLWWGHRIPAWFCPDGHVTVTDAEGGPDACAECGRPASELTQETDIFDTWFSSGLWPFSTLGWPDETPDMTRFYPTSVMETGYDILFFWVARMMMLGLFLHRCRAVPHRLPARDDPRRGRHQDEQDEGQQRRPARHRRGDRSRCAPLRAGARLGTGQRHAPHAGQARWRPQLHQQAVERGALRPGQPAGVRWQAGGAPSLAARWIRSRLADATARATRQLDALDLGGYAATVYDVAWSDYCDWFLEMAKVDLRREDAGDADRAATWAAAADGLATLLRLLHPLMPFVTEEIWQALREAAPDTSDESLLIAARVAAGAASGTRVPRPRSPTLPPWCEACVASEPRQARRRRRGRRSRSSRPTMRPRPRCGPTSATSRRWHGCARSRSSTARSARSSWPRAGSGWHGWSRTGRADALAAGRRQAQLAEMDAQHRTARGAARQRLVHGSRARTGRRARARAARRPREQRGQLARRERIARSGHGGPPDGW